YGDVRALAGLRSAPQADRRPGCCENPAAASPGAGWHDRGGVFVQVSLVQRVAAPLAAATLLAAALAPLAAAQEPLAPSREPQTFTVGAGRFREANLGTVD